MDNYQIADNFSLLAKLCDIHGENSFKSKSYASAAFAIEKLPTPLSEIPAEKIPTLKGIGTSSAQKIVELLHTGKLKSLDELILKTPPGILEMMNIKGIGPKKINAIWKEMDIESVGELLYACKENRLKLFKGFGEKTQQNVADSIEFYQMNRGSFLYVQALQAAPLLHTYLGKIFTNKRIEITGAFRRQLEVMDDLEFVIEADLPTIEKTLQQQEGFQLVETLGQSIIYKTSAGVNIKIHAADPGNFAGILLKTSSSPAFVEALLREANFAELPETATEEAIFKAIGLQWVPAALREDVDVVNIARSNNLPAIITPPDVRGIIHSHSNWSDGSNTIEEMAMAAIARGMEYLVITDHSKSAFYAQGLHEEKILEQHRYIDELNERLAPFKIFKSIESDILNDGNLDYSNNVLATFDMVIASVHSNLKMTEEKAMARILKAIENPYTTIIGHLTGRLLLSRPGYPVNHEAIINACVQHKVVIELNANPNRLDIDWRHIRKALDKGALISINPDAHAIGGLDDTLYGVLVAQKAMVTPSQNLSSFNLQNFEQFLAQRRVDKNI